jgi:hypothetical protein
MKSRRRPAVMHGSDHCSSSNLLEERTSNGAVKPENVPTHRGPKATHEDGTSYYGFCEASTSAPGARGYGSLALAALLIGNGLSRAEDGRSKKWSREEELAIQSTMACFHRARVKSLA